METFVKMKCAETSNIIPGLVREFAAAVGGTTVLDPGQDSADRVADPPPPPDEEEHSLPSIPLDHQPQLRQKSMRDVTCTGRGTTPTGRGTTPTGRGTTPTGNQRTSSGAESSTNVEHH
ncbi:unnamed protein product [Merluccius merluccius]